MENLKLTQNRTLRSEITGWKSWRYKLYDAAVKISDQLYKRDTITAYYKINFDKRLRRYFLPYSPVFKRGPVTAGSDSEGCTPGLGTRCQEVPLSAVLASALA